VENKARHAARSFLIELMLYAGLIVVYVFFVIAFLGNWLDALYEHNKVRYAFAALLLIIGQGVVLEMVTTILLRFIRRSTD
jgi:cytochrome c biogenesis protein CcdA